MSDIPNRVPREWHDSLEVLRERVKSYPEDPEDRAIREYDERLAVIPPEAQERLRNFVFGDELRVAIDEDIDEEMIEIIGHCTNDVRDCELMRSAIALKDAEPKNEQAQAIRQELAKSACKVCVEVYLSDLKYLQ